jgi:hypothetical protein
MLLSEYLADDNEHSEQGNPSVKCNAVYISKKSLNCYLTPSQAIEFAQRLLQKAQLILDNDIEDAVVQVWNTRPSYAMNFGLIKAVKRHRRKK